MSKLIPLLETIIQNRGGNAEQWKAAGKTLNSKPEEFINLT